MARIIILARNRKVRNTRALVLDMTGHCCDTASSPQQALELAREDSFDLLIADRRLLDSSRSDVAKKIKRFRPRLKIIVLVKDEDDVLANENYAVDVIPCAVEVLFWWIQAFFAGGSPKLARRRDEESPIDRCRGDRRGLRAD